MAQEWHLPDWLVRVCREHHKPGTQAPSELHVVRMISAMAEMRVSPRWAPWRLDDIQQSATALKLNKFQLRAAATQIGELVKKAEAMLKMAARS